MNGAPAFGPGSSTYALGAFDERRRLEREHRVAAFGAIRRAAGIMRQYEIEADLCSDIEWACEINQQAIAIRRAIRAAIGSAAE